MPLKQRRPPEEEQGGLTEPLIPAVPAGEAAAGAGAAPPGSAPPPAAPPAAGRTVSVVLPTPFRDAALAPAAGGGSGGSGGLPGEGGAPPLGLPPRKAGGVLRDKYGRWRTLWVGNFDGLLS